VLSFIGGSERQSFGLVVLLSHISGICPLVSRGIRRFLEFFSEARKLFFECGGIKPELLPEFIVRTLLDFLRLLAGLCLADLVLHFGERIDALLQLVEFFLESLVALQEPDAKSGNQDEQHSNESGPSLYAPAQLVHCKADDGERLCVIGDRDLESRAEERL
jgi:hypothetical protein